MSDPKRNLYRPGERERENERKRKKEREIERLHTQLDRRLHMRLGE